MSPGLNELLMQYRVINKFIYNSFRLLGILVLQVISVTIDCVVTLQYIPYMGKVSELIFNDQINQKGINSDNFGLADHG